MLSGWVNGKWGVFDFRSNVTAGRNKLYNEKGKEFRGRVMLKKVHTTDKHETREGGRKEK
jgi:hypothetical protein